MHNARRCTGFQNGSSSTATSLCLSPRWATQPSLPRRSRAMFSSDVHGAAADVSHYIAILNEYALRMLRRPWLFLLPRRIPTPFNYEQQRALKALNKIVHNIIQARRKQPHALDDLL